MKRIDRRMAEIAASGRRPAPPGRTLAELALARTAGDPDHACLADGSRALSRADMLDAALRLGGAMAGRGLTPGAVVAFQLPNWWEAAALNLAAALFGWRIVPLMTIYRRAELQTILAACEVDAIFVPRTHRGTDHAALVSGLDAAPRHVITVRDSGPDSFDALLATPPAVATPADSADAKIVIFTSGSTGRPKGVIHTHDGMHALVQETAAFWGTTPGDTLYVPSPIGHVGGSIYAFEFPWITGCGVLLDDGWDPDRALARMTTGRATFMAGATPFLSGLIEAAERAETGLPDLRRFVCGGASVPPELVHRGLDRFPGAVVSRAYGSSEVPLACPGARDRADALDAAATDGELTVEARILDDAGADVPKGAEGEVALRAPQMFAGYLDAADETGAFTPDGFFRMGDLGRLVRGRFLVVTGRKKDIIIRKGENISPVEVENALMTHPAVLDCAVVGRPDPLRGELAVAFVVTAPGATLDLAALVAHLDTAGLARQKCPEALVLLDALPKSLVGKVDKPALRQRAAAMADATP